jgi:lambda repressor-like predicted transcriptional regulator
MPCHHNLEQALTPYIDGAGLAADSEGAALPHHRPRHRRAHSHFPAQANAYAMIRRRAEAAGIKTKIGNHSFPATSITAYLKNGGTLEKAESMENHASTRTTEPQLTENRLCMNRIVAEQRNC